MGPIATDGEAWPVGLCKTVSTVGTAKSAEQIEMLPRLWTWQRVIFRENSLKIDV